MSPGYSASLLSVYIGRDSAVVGRLIFKLQGLTNRCYPRTIDGIRVPYRRNMHILYGKSGLQIEKPQLTGVFERSVSLHLCLWNKSVYGPEGERKGESQAL